MAKCECFAHDESECACGAWAKANDEEVCEWVSDYKDKIYDGHSTPHGKKYYVPVWDFTYCPYCSKKIKVKE